MKNNFRNYFLSTFQKITVTLSGRVCKSTNKKIKKILALSYQRNLFSLETLLWFSSSSLLSELEETGIIHLYL